MFFRKFTAKETKQYERLRRDSMRDARRDAATRIASQQSRLNAAIKTAESTQQRKETRRLRGELESLMESAEEAALVDAEGRFRGKWSHPILVYEAKHVGISPTGAPASNELYPSGQLPKDVTETALDVYRRFFANPERAYSDYWTQPGQDIVGGRWLVVKSGELEKWDVHGGRAAAFVRANPTFVRLGDFAEEATVSVKPSSQPDKLWPVYGVNNRAGVVLSQYQKGSEFNSNYKRIEVDWFVHNPTRAVVGSLGRVSKAEDDAITSPEYQVWKLKPGPDGKRLLPEYVEALIATGYFRRIIHFNRIGGVKQRMYVDNLLEIRIPFLSEEQQRAAAEVRCDAISRMRQAQVDLAQLEADLGDALRDSTSGMAAVDLETPASDPDDE